MTSIRWGEPTGLHRTRPFLVCYRNHTSRTLKLGTSLVYTVGGGLVRFKTKHGYIVISSPGHPLAWKKGACYEHRVVAYAAYGPFPKEWVVHHRNGITDDNRAENLIVCRTHHHHAGHHRSRQDLRCSDEPNVTVVCGCGCGGKFWKYDYDGRPREFLPFHFRRPFAGADRKRLRETRKAYIAQWKAQYGPEAARLRAQGLSFRAVGRALGISYGSVIRLERGLHTW